MFVYEFCYVKWSQIPSLNHENSWSDLTIYFLKKEKIPFREFTFAEWDSAARYIERRIFIQSPGESSPIWREMTYIFLIGFFSLSVDARLILAARSR